MCRHSVSWQVSTSRRSRCKSRRRLTLFKTTLGSNTVAFWSVLLSSSVSMSSLTFYFYVLIQCFWCADTGRHYQPVSSIKRILDSMAYSKLVSLVVSVPVLACNFCGERFWLWVYAECATLAYCRWGIISSGNSFVSAALEGLVLEGGTVYHGRRSGNCWVCIHLLLESFFTVPLWCTRASLNCSDEQICAFEGHSCHAGVGCAWSRRFLVSSKCYMKLSEAMIRSHFYT